MTKSTTSLPSAALIGYRGGGERKNRTRFFLLADACGAPERRLLRYVICCWKSGLTNGSKFGPPENRNTPQDAAKRRQTPQSL